MKRKFNFGHYEIVINGRDFKIYSFGYQKKKLKKNIIFSTIRQDLTKNK